MPFEQAWPYVVTVYLGIWAILVCYLGFIIWKVSRLRKETEHLAKLVAGKTEEPHEPAEGG